MQAGIIVGQAAADDLIAYRTGDRDESITFTPGPLAPGVWTFAPPPSLQTAQTAWAAVMRPFMLQSPSQFRVEPPPALTSPQWAREYNEIKAYSAADSTVRTPEETAVARFWNAASVNQSNQAFQDVAITHGMGLVDTARLLAMGDLVDSDVGIACSGLQIPLPVLPHHRGDPKRPDRRKLRHPARPQLDAAARNPESPRIPGRAHVHHWR